MTPKQEDSHTEFKSSFSDKVIVGLVAFANAKGGTVYIGVDDDGTVVGVRLGKETVAQWINGPQSPRMAADFWRDYGDSSSRY